MKFIYFKKTKYDHITFMVVAIIFLVVFILNRDNRIFAGHKVKLFHVANDLRDISFLLEDFYLKEGSYPIPDNAKIIVSGGTEEISLGYVPAFILKEENIPDLLLDLYTGKMKLNYRYATNFKNAWILICNGPDKVPNIRKRPVGELLNKPSEEWEEFVDDNLMMNKYDPTNGIESPGDVFRYNDTPTLEPFPEDYEHRPNKYYDYTF